MKFPKALAFLLLLVFTVGCSLLEGTPEATEQPDAATATGAVATVAATPEPTPTATPTPEPTPLSPGVVIRDQALDESGTLVAELVTLPGPGWLTIYRTLEGEADEIIGRLPLAAGSHENVEITVDTEMATEELLAGVHMDAGAEGVFEFPGEDEPYPGEPEAPFIVELQLPFPQIVVEDQPVLEDGVVMIASAELLEPTWIAIHAEDDGAVGEVVGALLMEPGVHENVTLPIHWRRATPTLYAVLHEDEGETGLFEFPSGDMPLLRNGQPIVASFQATFPPEILVYDQPVIDNTISIERVISDGPGWIVIYNEEDGQPGFIIGSAALEDGVNEQVAVSLLQTAITSQLFARLHADTEPGDAFNFPGQDPALLYNDRLPTATAFRTIESAHVFVNDQPLTDENTVTVAVIVVPVPTWAILYTVNEDGQADDLVGQVLLEPGINRDVVFDLEEATEPGEMQLVLYRDLGEAGEFESPPIDYLLTNDDNRPIRIHFALLSAAAD